MCSCETVAMGLKVLVSKGWLQSEITVRHYNGKKQTGGKGWGRVKDMAFSFALVK